MRTVLKQESSNARPRRKTDLQANEGDGAGGESLGESGVIGCVSFVISMLDKHVEENRSLTLMSWMRCVDSHIHLQICPNQPTVSQSS